MLLLLAPIYFSVIPFVLVAVDSAEAREVAQTAAVVVPLLLKVLLAETLTLNRRCLQVGSLDRSR